MEDLRGDAFLVAVALAALVTLATARQVKRSAFEPYTGRLLLQGALCSAVLAGVLCLVLGLLHLGSPLMSVYEKVPAVLILLALVKVAWNVVGFHSRIKARYALKPCASKSLEALITQACRTLGVSAPSVYQSERTRFPFVFGLSTSQAHLVLPEDSSDGGEAEQEAMFLHELAHLRNGDVGVVALTSCLLRNFSWLLSALTVSQGLCWLGIPTLWQAGSVLNAGWLLLVCLILLRFTWAGILRERELAADRTVAVLLERGGLLRALVSGGVGARGGAAAGLMEEYLRRGVSSTVRWLEDKALFGRGGVVWRWLHRAAWLLLAQHPTHARREESLSKAEEQANRRYQSLPNCLLCGMVNGSLGVVCALGAYWLHRKLVPGGDQEEALKLAWEALGVAAFPIVGFIAMVMVLPVWFSRQAVRPKLRYVTGLVPRLVLVSLGECVTLLVILIAGTGHEELLVLTFLVGSWFLVIMVLCAGVAIVEVILWTLLHYWVPGMWIDFLALVRVVFLSLVICVAFPLAVALLSAREHPAFCIAVVLAVLLALGLGRGLKVVPPMSVSGVDQYAIVVFAKRMVRIEAEAFKKRAPFYISGVLSCVYGIMETLFCFLSFNVIQAIGSIAAPEILILPLGVCGVGLCMFAWNHDAFEHGGHVQERVLLVVSTLRLLGAWPQAKDGALCAKIRVLFGVEKPQDCDLRRGVVTIERLWQRMQVLAEDEEWRRSIPEARAWVQACGASGGYGLWPEGRPRLVSTFFAVDILEKTGGLGSEDVGLHAHWVETLQEKEGYFRGPWSRRRDYEETWFAVRLLRGLGQPLAGKALENCLRWTRQRLERALLLREGPDAVFCCLAVLSEAGELDPDTCINVAKWAQEMLPTLAVANPVRAIPHIYYLLKVRVLCNRYLSVDQQTGAVLDQVRERLERVLRLELSRVK